MALPTPEVRINKPGRKTRLGGDHWALSVADLAGELVHGAPRGSGHGGAGVGKH